MRQVVFVDAARTAFGRMGGTLKEIKPGDLAGHAIRGLVEKSRILERGTVDSVFAGSSLHDVQALNPARYATLAAGLPFEVTASYVEMQCGSAIDAINHAAWKILAGGAEVVIAGGMESYSQYYVKFSMATEPYKLNPPLPVMQKLTPVPTDDIPMMEINERIATKWDITREECDEFAYQSQHRAGKAMAAGYFKDEIVPITIPGGKKVPDIVFDTDEHPRPATTLEALSGLQAVLGPDRVTTAGNASGRNDGAAFVLMMSAEKAVELGYTPYARWVAGAESGVDPKYMGIGPAYSNMLALKRGGLTMADIDVWECNEAFAAQNLAVIKEMETLGGVTIDRAKWNPNGGAIAFGHPNGASGARICMFALKELERSGGRYGLFSACCGGGMGVSTLIENLR
ncbi:MAG: thiolase family protein [Oscillospiraceae bacterium]|nr:thiolase family protein [Oscillospiraceae bacterium]